MMSYPASVEFLYGLQRRGIKLGLDTIEAMLARLGRPHDRYPALHIAGTNGKGSTAAMAASVLQAAGYRTGLYTSPHLVDFRERIRVNHEPIPEDGVSDVTEHVREALGSALHPTFFEFATALALQYFADAEVDVAVIEVGMGGRFDATTAVTPLVSAITNVALDHEEYLGRTVEAVAFEKAGIIKRGVPVVAGRLTADAAGVIGRIAAERRAPLFRLGSEFRVEADPPEGFRYEGLRDTYEGLSCQLRGAHQLDNAACALAMLELAATRGLPYSEDSIRRGLATVSWEGRLEVAEQHPLLVLDGAHNPAAAEALAAYLVSHRRSHPDSRIIAVVGMMRDKNRAGFLRIILPLVDEMILTRAQTDRAATVEELRASLGARGETAYLAPLPADALARARRLASSADLICVTGSLMLVGEVKALLRGCALSPLRG